MKRLYFKIMLLLAFFTLCNYKNVFAQTRAQDSTALVTFYNNCGGASWTNSTNWLSATEPMNNWFGITISNGRLQAIVLPNNNIAGNVTNLTNVLANNATLQTLNLSGNALIGTFPSVGTSTNGLVTINMSYNQLTGITPTFKGSANGVTLNGGSNSCSITSGSTLVTVTTGNTASLAVGMYLGGNVGLSPYTTITTINSSTQFTVSKPLTTTNAAVLFDFFTLSNMYFGNLTTIDFSHNNLSGAIPTFGGTVFPGPNFKTLYSVPNLASIDLSYNQYISGTLNAAVNPVTTYNVSNNKLADNNLGTPTATIVNLNLSNNAITGSVPYFNSAALTTIDISYNKFSGTFNYYPSANVSYFNVANNLMTGALPTPGATQIGPNLTYFNIDSNRFVFNTLGALFSNWTKVGSTPLYSPQDSILPLVYNAGTLTLTIASNANNTFKWYKNGALISTTTGATGNTLSPTGDGVYSVAITNTTFPSLTLYSANYTLTTGIINFYSKSSGNLEVLTNWGTNTDGTGTNPTNFTTANQVFNIVNQTAATIGASWTVSGTGSKVVVGNGSNTTNFTIPSTFAVTGTVDALYRGTLTIQNTTIPTIGTLSTGSTVSFNGTSSQAIPTATYDILTINNAAGCTLVGSISVATNLNLTAGLLALGNNNITLLSTASKTASVPTIGTGTLSYGTGTFIVQRYIPSGKRAYRFLSHPFASAIPLSQLTPTIDITGTGGATNGFTATASNAASAFTYNASTPAWAAFANTSSSSWSKCQGIRLMVRGAKGEGLLGEIPVTSNPTAGQYVPSAVTLSMSGQINTGSQTVPLTYTAATPTYNLVGNPYPAPIDARLVTGGNIASTYYTWDASVATMAQPRGMYVANQFAGLSNILPSGSAFFVLANAASASVSFTETIKATSTPTTILGRGTNSNNEMLELLVKEDGITDDRLLINFRNDAASKKDYWDGDKLMNPTLNFYSISSDNQKLGIDSRSSITANETIPLSFETLTNMDYTIEVAGSTYLENKVVMLHDKMLNTLTELKIGTTYTFTVTANAASRGNRFELIVNQKTNASITDVPVIFSVTLASTIINDLCIIKIVSPNDNATTVRMVNLMGQTVATLNAGVMNSGKLSISTSQLPKGLYMVEVVIGNNRTVLKAIK